MLVVDHTIQTSFADRLDAPLEVAGLRTLIVDVAYGGDSFVIADAKTLGFAIKPDEARDLAELGMEDNSRRQRNNLGFTHPENPVWDHISFCQFAGPLGREGGEINGPNAVVVRLGKIDRSPTGTGMQRPYGRPGGARRLEAGGNLSWGAPSSAPSSSARVARRSQVARRLSL